MEGLPDHELMARVAAGDQTAFRLLARRHTPRALAIARRILGSHALADEVVQEALLRVWTNAPRWRPTAQLRTWLYRIVVNLCLDEKRRPQAAPLEAAGDVADPDADAARDLEARERDRLVTAAIDALPPRQRAAIVLTYQEGLGNAEAAAVLDTSVGGIETLLVRARRTLRASLGPSLEP
jgi:RNA polymerase sigma-70 factor (ECF subfamily)